ncbi:MarR family winged helix-turn-helix transcriptional regulator [Agrobacterium tumefaciens]|uniref:MarR family winged helix-turn-helix transcriptional regulator n=1 Tax=Agrobacterium tumefaciens TaxID=358 RepID=UPI001573DCF7|nr:MarR family transcriptional regulator [Agrobacterium tumefaciens]WCK69133.1 MarR family transcriptional regulator [Agrobacterium tumefaciens]
MSLAGDVAEDAELPSALYDGLAGFRLAMRRFLSLSDAALAKADVTSQQYQAMLVIKTAPEGKMRIRDFSELMLIQAHGAVQLVDRLAAAGLVERTPSQRDKRSILISLTPKGEHILRTLARIHLEGLLANQDLLVESLGKLRDLNELT